MPAPEADVALFPNGLTVARQTKADSETLVLNGDIDLASAPVLERALHDAECSRPRRVVLDLAALDFLGSAAIHLLDDAQQRAEANSHELVLTRVPACAQRLFALTGIDARLTVE